MYWSRDLLGSKCLLQRVILTGYQIRDMLQKSLCGPQEEDTNV